MKTKAHHINATDPEGCRPGNNVTGKAFRFLRGRHHDRPLMHSTGFGAFCCAAACCIFVNGSNAAVFVDFTSEGWPNTPGGTGNYDGVTYNKAGIPSRTVNIASITSQISINGMISDTGGELVDGTGAASGIHFSIGALQVPGHYYNISTGDPGDYTGLAPHGNIFPAASYNQGMYVNNSGVLTFTFSGLDPGAAYDLTAFSGYNVGGGGPFTYSAKWSLTDGLAETAQYWSTTSDQPTLFNNGDTIDSYGVDEAKLIQWLHITPNANGQTTFHLTSAVGIGQINALSLQTVPEPSTTLLAAGGCFLLLTRRRRRCHTASFIHCLRGNSIDPHTRP